MNGNGFNEIERIQLSWPALSPIYKGQRFWRSFPKKFVLIKTNDEGWTDADGSLTAGFECSRYKGQFSCRRAERTWVITFQY